MADVVDIPEFRAFYYTDDTPRQFYTLRRYEDESGSGKMHCYNIAPGIQLSFYAFYSHAHTVPSFRWSNL